MSAEVAEHPSGPPARQVVYCGVCSLPPEYCEFGGTVKKCEEWLHKNHPDMHQKLYSAEALSANLSALSVEAQKRAEKDAAKKTAKAAAAEQREAERKAEAVVLIKRVERNKRKYVTVVSGLEDHGLDLKKVAKELGKKFATGSSVTKTASGGEEITVQGDVSDDLYDWLTEKYPDIPEDNIDMKDETKKKGGS
ncbi:translation machinery-associated protein 22 [Exophiala spinifera]|uniref:Translation machinery-associated protein 22 n=1 Tax=Exophiala spinifera TaxID=91928 RepID=A0A0D2C0F8_9EURO|nr:translation machinery-associated protein 22 [Exophiala spinifera]KIW17104.1 translation machinery-associated protein 22 [Exophiala spinifera]